MNLEEQNLNEVENPQLNIGAVMRSALRWWSKLTKSQQRTYEMQIFGYGEWWEDNSLHNEDIVKMYQHYA